MENNQITCGNCGTVIVDKECEMCTKREECTAVENEDGSGSLIGELIGMGF